MFSPMFSWEKALGLSIAAGLLAGCFSIILQVRGEVIVQGPVVTEQSSNPSINNGLMPNTGMMANGSAPRNAGLPFATGVSAAAAAAPTKPLRLVIPAIGVDAAVQSVGLFWSGNGEMGIPTNFTDVAWYNGGPVPGAPGSAVIDGHLDGKNVKEAVFYNLGNLETGDLVDVIDASGTIEKFSVVATKLYPYNASTSDIFSGDTSQARLNLITCAGDWIPSQRVYNERVVVFTQLVASE